MKKRIRKKLPRPHPVTDHALVRYLERIVGIDIVGIKDGIIAGREPGIAKTEAAELIVHERHMKLTIRNGSVVTVKSLK